MGTIPSTALEAGVEATIAAILALLVGFLVVDAVLRLLAADLQTVTRLGLAPLGFVALTYVLMLLHITSGGWVFSHPGFIWMSTGRWWQPPWLSGCGIVDRMRPPDESCG